MEDHAVCDDKPEMIAEAIHKMLDKGMDMIICTGGMSVDPDDRTPLAIKNVAEDIVTYGAPVLPGAMFMLAYYNGDIPVMGIAGAASCMRKGPYLIWCFQECCATRS